MTTLQAGAENAVICTPEQVGSEYHFANSWKVRQLCLSHEELRRQRDELKNIVRRVEALLEIGTTEDCRKFIEECRKWI